MKPLKGNSTSHFGLPPLPSNSPDTIAALMWAREVLQEHQKRLYAVEDPEGIEELTSVTIGGVEQWLHIRGRNRNNPVLLFLHGGPGGGMIGFMDAWQRGWEDYFTVVQWDQRQTGKSYYPADDENNPLTIERFVSDTEEVIQYLRSHLEKDKLFVVGASWGTALGMYMVKRHPEWLHAYVAIGQVVNIMENERLLYERALGHAKAQNKDELIAKLESIAPYPDPNRVVDSFMENLVLARRALSDLGREALTHNQSWDDFIRMWTFSNLISPHLTVQDHSNSVFGDDNALIRDPSFCHEFMSIDLPEQLGSSFDVPIFFFTGAHDWQTPVPLSDQWFSEIEAPHKQLVHFENSAHALFTEQPGKLLVELVNRVLPIADGSANPVAAKAPDITEV